MKKVILEEIENMRYLLGYKRGVVISEQEVEKDDMIDKYSSKSIANQIDSGDLSTLNPAAADAIKKAQNMVGGQSVLPNATTGAPTTGAPTTGAPTTGAPEATTQAAPVTPVKIGVKYPSIEELQNTLITKFQSVLTKDGKYGPKTAASVLAALQKLPVNSTETKTPDTTAGDPNSDVAKKTAEANPPTNGVVSNDPNKNTQPTAGGTNFAEVDGNEFV